MYIRILNVCCIFKSLSDKLILECGRFSIKDLLRDTNKQTYTQTTTHTYTRTHTRTPVLCLTSSTCVVRQERERESASVCARERESAREKEAEIYSHSEHIYMHSQTSRTVRLYTSRIVCYIIGPKK